MKILIKETAKVVEVHSICEEIDYDNPLVPYQVVQYQDKEGHRYKKEDVIDVSVDKFWGRFRCNTASQILEGNGILSTGDAVDIANKLIVELNK